VSALIVAATFGAATQAALDRLRGQWFPPERDQLPAHLTLFHALPADAAEEVTAALGRVCAREAPAAEVTGVRSLGRGAALVVTSPGLERARAELAAAFAGRLTRQDAHGFRPHVTVQNFVAPEVARATVAELSAGFVPWPLELTGLAVHRYLGGPWERLAAAGFVGGGT
jgi:2'-5' RNA ligase